MNQKKKAALRYACFPAPREGMSTSRRTRRNLLKPMVKSFNLSAMSIDLNSFRHQRTVNFMPSEWRLGPVGIT